MNERRVKVEFALIGLLSLAGLASLVISWF